MEKDHLSRKLTVILHADVVGSTLLVQMNEALAHERIQATFNKFSETIIAYGGIAREIRGDALVAEFERASDAVTASLAFQILSGDLNSAIKDKIQPQLRIGISLGEVIVADDTITGAGVVLAQRLEQLAVEYHIKPAGVADMHKEPSPVGHNELLALLQDTGEEVAAIGFANLDPDPGVGAQQNARAAGQGRDLFRRGFYDGGGLGLV